MVDIPSGCQLRSVSQRLLCRFTDRDFILRGGGLRCGLLGFRWRCGSLRLGLGIHCGNGLNWIAHGYHLALLLSTSEEITLARASEKDRKRVSDSKRKQKGLAESTWRALSALSRSVAYRCYVLAAFAAKRSCMRRVRCGTIPRIRSISINWPRWCISCSFTDRIMSKRDLDGWLAP